MAGKEASGLDQVLGGHPHAPTRAGQDLVGYLLQVGHGLHVQPALGDGHHQIGPAKPQGPQHQDTTINLAAPFPQQILPGDPQMHLTGVQSLGDIARRQQPHLGPRQTLEVGHVAPRAAGDDEPQAAVPEPGLHLLLEPALGGHGDDQGFAHDSPPCQARHGLTMHPTARTPAAPPRRAGSPS